MKYICLTLLALILTVHQAWAVAEEYRVTLINGAVGALTSGPFQIPSRDTKVAQVTALGSGSISGVIKLYGGMQKTLTPTTGILVCQITFSGTAPVPDYCPPWTAPWPWYLADFSSPSGTITGVTFEAGY